MLHHRHKKGRFGGVRTNKEQVLEREVNLRGGRDPQCSGWGKKKKGMRSKRRAAWPGWTNCAAGSGQEHPKMTGKNFKGHN